MAGAGKKTFTAGEVLTASDVNTYLMEQSVMYFGGTAARASAIPTPTTGMTTYIGVTGTASIPQIETYTGSAWQTPYGMTLVANVTATNAATIAVNNVFTSAYENYMIKFVGTGSHTSATTVGLNVAASGTGAPSTWERLYVVSGDNYGPTRTWAFAQASAVVGSGGDTRLAFDTTVFSPALAVRTSNVFQGFSRSSVSGDSFQGGNLHGSAAAYDGLILSASSGNLTGNLRVYGLRNS
jgi:hypothetical protein